VIGLKSELAEEGIAVSIRWLCEVLGIPRASVYREPRQRSRYAVNESLAAEIKGVIDQNPSFGVRRIHWALNRNRQNRVNVKAVRRIVKAKGWIMAKRPKGLRPRVHGLRSRIDRPDRRWAIDTTHFSTRRDGWCHMTAIIDCCDRTIVGWRISRSGKAAIAAAALEDALIRRNPGAGLILRSDNGLVFGSESFSRVARGAGMLQEFITPYTPEQNGMIERWFLTLKSECIWLQNFETVEDARIKIDAFIDSYNTTRPHRSLGMVSPAEWREKYAA